MLKNLVAIAALSAAISGCATPLASPPPLAAQNGLSAEQVGEVMARLAQARRAARGRFALPFTLSCKDEARSDACADGGRRALAALPLDRVQAVRPIYNQECIRTLFEYPEDHCPPRVRDEPRRIDAYEISLPFAGGNGLTWKVGLAPAKGLKAIEMERGTVIYH